MKKNLKQIYHSWDKWECYKNGFYNSTLPIGLGDLNAAKLYKDFLSNLLWFRSAMERLEKEWPNSCQHFLTNPNINRIAWLGQAAMCIETKVPAKFRYGFKLLSEQEQINANNEAEKFLNEYLTKNNYV